MLSWLKKKEVPIAAPFAAIGTDMHSHLIPGIDDGAKSVEGAIALVEGLSKLGYKKLINTPHVMSDYYKNAPETILAGLETVRAEIDRQNIDIQIDVAAEYYLDEPFLEKIGKEQLLTFGDNYLLFELSYLNPPGELMEAIFKMKSHGYQLSLIHI